MTNFMAQIIQVPIEFEFSFSPAEWALSTAVVTGWWQRDERTDDEKHLSGVIEGSSVPPFELDARFLPDGLVAQLYKSKPADVEQVCSRYKIECFVRSSRPPVLRYEKHKKIQKADAWAMREEFLRLDPSSDAFLQFLRKWGDWNGKQFIIIEEIKRSYAALRVSLTNSEILWMSGWWRPQLLGEMIQSRQEYPHFFLHVSDCLSAIQATILIDLVRNVKFQICARPDCATPFPLTSKHEKKYCSWYCGHFESVRRGRKHPDSDTTLNKQKRR
jgi:hypothetical protein